MDIEITRTGVHSHETAWRGSALALIGPFTTLAGVVWAVAQPYRLAPIDHWAASAWDYAAQPPLLVVAVGLIFEFAVALPLLRQLRGTP